ncbi:DUF397 domain-containing protein [Streptomyces sp. NBC_00853]|uniref:DUF397 domain-containing protein n=1 Tax=Streptomyces sp. NBC_00853 TaxID=2903681 RepID=UPI003872B8D8|nr:DUF397 domain-containing protein [Streptomyces sp. NBC_00853]
MSIRADQLPVDWFSSSYSNDQSGQCVRGGRFDNGDMAVSDSKVPDGAAFVVGPRAWRSFIDNVKHAD